MLGVTGENRIKELLEAKVRVQAERKDYEVMAEVARKGLQAIDQQLAAIEQELQGSFKGRNNYSHAEVMAARQGINRVLSSEGMTLGDLKQELPDLDGYLLERELKWLVNRSNSPVVWNGRRGIASMYYRRSAT